MSHSSDHHFIILPKLPRLPLWHLTFPYKFRLHITYILIILISMLIPFFTLKLLSCELVCFFPRICRFLARVCPQMCTRCPLWSLWVPRLLGLLLCLGLGGVGGKCPLFGGCYGCGISSCRRRRNRCRGPRRRSGLGLCNGGCLGQIECFGGRKFERAVLRISG